MSDKASGGDSKSYDNLQEIVQEVSDIDKDRVSVSDVLDVVGMRSFGPLLVIIGLVLAIPGISDIPGVPVVFGSLIILTIGQQVIGRENIWLPKWLLNRSVKKKYVKKTLSYTEKPAKKVDKWTTGRLGKLVESKVSVYISSVACLTIAGLTPAMEVVLFSANMAGVCLFLFGLAYLTRDGLVLVLSYLLYFGLLALIVFGLL